MKIYFGRISDENRDQFENHYYTAPENWSGFKGLAKGDYVFMICKGSVSLWQTSDYDVGAGCRRFVPILNGIFKKTAPLMHFKYFKLSMDLVVKTMRHVRSQGFFELEFDSALDEQKLRDKSTYEAKENFRKTIIRNSFATVQADSYDVQLYFKDSKLCCADIKNADNSYYEKYRDNLEYSGKGQPQKDKVLDFIKNVSNHEKFFGYSDVLNVSRIYDTFMVDYKEQSLESVFCWSGGVKWGDNDKLNDFKKGNYWQIGWDKTDKKKGAIQAWKNIKEIEPGDFLAFHGLGGKYDLVIYQVSKVLEVDEDKGVLKLENLSGSSVVYRGKAPQMSGGWFGTLLPVTGKAVDSIFGKYIQDGEMNETLAEKKENMNVSLNTILYGPPGTGKTFNTMAYAVAICEEKNVSEVKKEMEIDYEAVKNRYDALKKAGRIEFVTFHQSYGYEDFIEGIRPDLDNTTGGLKYKLEVGCFKSFCDRVFGNFEEAWKNLCDKLDDEEKGFLEIPYISDKERTFPIEWNASHNGLKAKGALRYFNKSQLENVYKNKPGVEKKGHDNYRKAIVNFMQKECGLKEYNGSEENKPLNNACVFIIDEINRGNISKIFGELITLIEPSKRIGSAEEMYAKLPCSGDEFGVPNNVYILGTMNTADRSIAMMDTALRRRFNFVEMMPDTSDSSPLKGKMIDDIDICEMLKTINKRIEYLYDREHTIGHAFFIGINDFAGLASVFKNKVIPLLQEYFYDDYEKIRLVLGDDGKSKEHQFVTKDAPEQNLFKGRDIDDGNDDEKYIYEINQNAFELPDSYKGII